MSKIDQSVRGQNKLSGTRDKFFYFIFNFLDFIKYNGLFGTITVVWHYIVVRLIAKKYNGTYKAYGFKIYYDNVQSVLNLLIEQFGLNYYYSRNSNAPIIVDIGANIGDSVLYFKWLYSNCSIYAFEPHPEAYKLLEMNVSENNLKNVKLFNVALGNHEGTMNLFSNILATYGDSTVSNELSNNIHGSSQKQYAVPIKISSQIRELQILEHIDILKIDIEGSESDLFESLEPLLPKTKKIFLEYHILPNVKENSFDRIISIFQKFGFNIGVTGFYRNQLNEPGHVVFLITAIK